MKTTDQGGERGYDGGKQITGRKRHISVDVLGLLLVVFGSSAALDDAVTAPEVLKHLGLAAYPRLEVIWADNKYHNHRLNEWIKTESSGNWRLEVVRRPEGSKGFVLLPKRWVVERTLAWLERCRRNSKDYERRTDSSASMLRVSAMHLMLKRLKPSNPTTILLEHALLAQGFMGVQKATFPRCLRPQNRDFTWANLVEALK